MLLLDATATMPTALKEPVSKPLEDRATGWITKLTTNAPELREIRDALIGSRAEMMDAVKELGLPHIPFAHASVDEFLENPEKLAKALKGDHYYYTIQPNDYAARVDTPSPAIASLDAIVELAQEFSSANSKVPFTIVLSEVKQIAFLGNIAVSQDGNIYGEFTDEGIPPTRSSLTRVFQFHKDHTLDTFKYSFENPELQKAIYQAVSLLPHLGTGRNREWNPGYYEVQLVPTDTGRLVPYFYDYRTSKAFTNLGNAA